MNPKRYILITGQGRSGTNWLLEILDQSRQTHCRNEPNGCAGSALSALPLGQVSCPEQEAKLESMWDTAIIRASHSFGDRDHHISVYKDHFSRSLHRMGLVRMVRGPRFRRVVGLVMPSRLQSEWPIPSWLENKQQQDRTLPVLKVGMVPGWIVWALRNRPEAHVLHIVRHPGGYLNSLINRWWSTADMGRVERDNRDRLAHVAASDPVWEDRFGDLGALSLVETEFWYWRYCTETIHQAGERNPRYQLVKYEDLTRNPVETSRSIYRACGLDWDNAVERAIRRSSTDSQALASTWRGKLSAEQIAMVEWVLHDSLMRDWWSDTDPAAEGLDGAHHVGSSTRLKSHE